jgi:tricorn protease
MKSVQPPRNLWFLRFIVCYLILACIQPAIGQNIIKLAQDPDLSPDGSRLVFEWQGDIWIANTRGGNARRLTETGNNRSAKFSPDGQKIAFVSSRDLGSNQIFVMPVAGGEPQRLTHHTDGFGLLQWTRDGQSLLVSANRDYDWRRGGRMFLIDADERSAERLLFDSAGSAGNLSPDGNQLLFTREGVAWWRKGYVGSQSSQIWHYRRNTGEFQLLDNEASGSRSPLWDPEGGGYYYVSGKDGAFNLYYRTLEPDESAVPRQLTRYTDDGVVTPCLSADGKTLVFRHLFDFYRMDLQDNQGPQRIRLTCRMDQARPEFQNVVLDSASEAAFSGDGLEVAMIAGGDLWVMDTVLREPKQITRTPEMESDPVFSADGNSIFFTSDAGGQRDIWVATRKDPQRYWWLNDEFELTRLTDDSVVESNLKISPAGDQLAFVKKNSGLWVMNPDGSQARCFQPSWDGPSFDWSPDGKWLTWAMMDENHNRDVYVGPLDGSLEPVNLSRHPRNDTQPVWSPDGKMIAFTGTRDENEIDIHIVVLQREQSESTSRDRKLEEALKKFKNSKRLGGGEPKGNGDAMPSGGEKTDTGAKPESGAKSDGAGTTTGETSNGQDNKTKEKSGSRLPEVTIDFEEIHSRIIRVPIPGSRESGLIWSPDSKLLAFNATIDSKAGLYKIEPPFELTPKLMMGQTVSAANWIETGKQILTLSGGVPTSLSESGQATRYPFRVHSQVDLPARYEAGFDEAWRAMRDGFYDGNLNNRNWDAIRRKYRSAARDAVDDSTFSAVVQMMLGELNGSHLGFTPSSGSRGRRRGEVSSAWNQSTAHFGLRFDPQHQGPGLLVRDVIYRSPSWQQRSQILPGETLMAINGVEIDPAMDLTKVLNHEPDQEFSLRVRNIAGEERLVSIRPISYSAARSLLYEHWERENQRKVLELSEGQFGYVHIRGMNMNSFYEFERDLFAVASGKAGLVIDVRDNGGGSTADHLLTVLTQPRHAVTIPRGGDTPGYPHDRMVYATWHKPIVVLCNQNSFSNAEIFSHAIKTLKRGRLVGVPTAGGVISTGSTTILDLGTLRMPGRGWYLIDTGEDMELNGAIPDVVLWPDPAEEVAGQDRQLETAIRLLAEDVQAWKDRPLPKLRKASERPTGR